ncbi:hypothetical protein G9A89_014066 [Geosiphon pyriformis]|nr:hypothetical protein G9A89_014066 [Geosiphon pyriformis]
MDQLGYQVDCTASAQIITTDRATKTPITYQILWADTNYNKLLSILSWDDKRKGKKEDKLKETIITEEITSGWKRFYSTDIRPEPPYILLKYKNCKKKLSSMKA